MNIFPKLKTGKWIELNLNEESRKTDLDLSNSAICTKWLNGLHKERGADYSWGGFLEDRTHIWRNHPNEKADTLIHLGIDYNIPAGTEVSIPLDGEVIHIMKDKGNKLGWGGRIIWKLSSGSYLLYGHLKQDFIVKVGEICKKGKIVGIVGDIKENGNWFPHIHIQIMDESFINKYKEDLNEIDGYLPKEDDKLNHVINPETIISI